MSNMVRIQDSIINLDGVQSVHIARAFVGYGSRFTVVVTWTNGSRVDVAEYDDIVSAGGIVDKLYEHMGGYFEFTPDTADGEMKAVIE